MGWAICTGRTLSPYPKTYFEWQRVERGIGDWGRGWRRMGPPAEPTASLTFISAKYESSNLKCYWLCWYKLGKTSFERWLIAITTGQYAFVESSEPRLAGEKAILTGPELSGSVCLSFKYHMFGKDIGSLTVFKHGSGVHRQRLWRRKGNMGNLWRNATINIDCREPLYQVLLCTVCVGSLWKLFCNICRIEITTAWISLVHR